MSGVNMFDSKEILCAILKFVKQNSLLRECQQLLAFKEFFNSCHGKQVTVLLFITVDCIYS